MPSQEPRNHCAFSKAAGPAAAAITHHASSSVPTVRAQPVMRWKMDSALLICGR
jgi:hypothetical protein